MNNDQILNKLKELDACQAAMNWVGTRTLAEIWSDCERRNWLFWLLQRINVDRKTLVLIACECARLALPCVKEGELRPVQAIEMAERWARNDPNVTIEMVREAGYASAECAADTVAYAAACAAYAAYASAECAAAWTYAAAEGAGTGYATLHERNRQCIATLKKYVSLEDVERGLS